MPRLRNGYGDSARDPFTRDKGSGAMDIRPRTTAPPCSTGPSPVLHSLLASARAAALPDSAVDVATGNADVVQVAIGELVERGP
jgi:hypothetical protein